MSVSITSLADIAGDNAVHQLATSGTAKWVQFNAPDANAGTVRVGDSNISITRGHPMIADAAMMFPPIPGNTYDLSTIYYRVPTGDKLNVIYAT